MKVNNPNVTEVGCGSGCTQFRCVFCRRGREDEDDIGKYGYLYQLEDITVHHLCCIFSETLRQSKVDEDGIFGFLPCDIKDEIRNVIKNVCQYCEKNFANVQCSYGMNSKVKRCQRYFHYTCGRDNGAKYTCTSAYTGRCRDHRKDHSSKTLNNFKLPDDWTCIYCTGNELEDLAKTTCCTACCGKKTYHKTCLQKEALFKGYFFRCPHPECSYARSTKRVIVDNGFRTSARDAGIFIPQCDADHLVEESDEDSIEMTALPLPVVLCSIDVSEDIRHDYDAFLRNGGGVNVRVSTRTPRPIIVSTVSPNKNSKTLAPLKWKRLRGGGEALATGDILDHRTSFLRLPPKESQLRKSNLLKCNLIILAYKGTAELRWMSENSEGMMDIYIKMNRNSIATIPPGAEYSISNGGSSEDAILFCFFKKISDFSPSPDISVVLANNLHWETAGKDLLGVWNCWADEAESHGYIELEENTMYPFSMNKTSTMLCVVVRGKLRLRTTELESKMEVENAKDDEESDYYLTSAELKRGSIFAIPLNACVSFENWADHPARIYYNYL